MICNHGIPPLIIRRWTGETMTITAGVVKTFIKTVQRYGCGYADISLLNSKTYIAIFRKGDELEEIARYPAWEVDANNNLGFYWDHNILSALPGYYFGDVYINDAYCFSLEFFIPRCAVEVNGHYHVEESTACQDPCPGICPPYSDGIPGVFPTFVPAPVSFSPDNGCINEQIPSDCDSGASCSVLPCEGAC